MEEGGLTKPSQWPSSASVLKKLDKKRSSTQSQAITDPGSYWGQCATREEGFVSGSFRRPGLYDLHRAALGLDLIKAPVNVLLALPAVIVALLSLTAARIGQTKAANILLRIPLGFPTAIERELIKRLRQGLLDLPSGEQPWQVAYGEEAGKLANAADKVVMRYAETRRAAADITSALIVGFIGLLLAETFTPGSLSAGQELAATVTQLRAEQDFFLGPTVGGWFYQVFPPDVGLGMQVGASLSVALLMSLVSAFSGILADPVQALLGLHQRRLRRCLRTLQRLGQQESDDFRPLDPYMARIVDLVDAFRGLS